MNRSLSKQWSQQSLASQPPARRGACMVYDAARQHTLLFGGGGLNDTWLWDGVSWTQLHPAVSPPARTSACMAYDSRQGTILLFGGVDIRGLPLADTWLWDGQSWTEQHLVQVPEARCGAVMAYAVKQQAMLLFGGEALDGRTGQLLQDTWLWDGTQWQEVTGAAPAARVGAALAYDSARQQLLLFGGTAGSSVYGDTWIWQEQGWQELSPGTSPSPRAWSSSAYDEASQQVVLVGGSQLATDTASPALSDTWSWDGTNWHLLDHLSAPAGGYYCAAYDRAKQALTLYASTTGKAALGNKQSRSEHPAIGLPPAPQGATWLFPSTPSASQ